MTDETKKKSEVAKAVEALYLALDKYCGSAGAQDLLVTLDALVYARSRETMSILIKEISRLESLIIKLRKKI